MKNTVLFQSKSTLWSGTNPNKALLCVGSVNLLNGMLPLNDTSNFMVVELTPEFHSGDNTIYLSSSHRIQTKSWIINHGKVILGGLISFADLFNNMIPSKKVIQIAQEYEIDVKEWVPLFVFLFSSVEDENDNKVSNLHTYSQIRFCRDDCLFIRTSKSPIEFVASKADEESLQFLQCVQNAVHTHNNNALFLNNHQCYYKKCYEGKEIETKYTIIGDSNIWELTVDLYNDLRDGCLDGYIMEFHDEFQQWDYLNHLFEIIEPVEQKGYISFIPTTDNSVIVKKKMFQQDQFIRGEIQYKTKIDGTYEEFIKNKYDITVKRLPSFRRVRYDVNFESIRSGHVYGIFFDHCNILDNSKIILQQCELEYLRSRIVLEPDLNCIMNEMQEIAEWLRKYLRSKNIEFRENYYSKLSFLKDNEGHL